jgi:RNA polymerase sigma-70 factor (ECF subfamily)
VHGSPPQEVSKLLHAWRDGDKAALDKLMPLVYGELHRLAHRYMTRERAGRTLQTTALVNEAYLRLVDLKQIQWQDRAHFFAIAASFMRRILVDFARSRGYQKRGGDADKVSLNESLFVSPEPGAELIRIDEALGALAEFDARKARVVELRFFGGMTEDETAEVLHVSRETVKRDWRLAKNWLLCELTNGGSNRESRAVAADRTDL